MTVGLKAYGAYIPRLRLARKAIADANAWFNPAIKGLAKGERAICNWDEDSLTMAVEAARDCLTPSRLDPDAAPSVTAVTFASTTFPFDDRQNAGILATALNFDEAVVTMDFAASQRAGTSGLMNGMRSAAAGDSLFVASDKRRTQASGPRIDRAKAELIRSIQGLSENFKFNIIAYDCGTRQWQGSMQEANDANKSAATGWVAGHRPTGATGTGPAAASALGDKDNMAVVLLTDGAPNCGASGSSGHRRMIANANTQGATVNVFGIAASGSYRSFCQGVASDNGGSYVDVP